MKKILFKILYVVLLVIIYPITWTGELLYYIVKPLLALSHLLMLHPNTARKIITDWRIMKDFSDI